MLHFSTNKAESEQSFLTVQPCAFVAPGLLRHEPPSCQCSGLIKIYEETGVFRPSVVSVKGAPRLWKPVMLGLASSRCGLICRGNCKTLYLPTLQECYLIWHLLRNTDLLTELRQFAGSSSVVVFLDILMQYFSSLLSDWLGLRYFITAFFFFLAKIAFSPLNVQPTCTKRFFFLDSIWLLTPLPKRQLQLLSRCWT